MNGNLIRLILFPNTLLTQADFYVKEKKKQHIKIELKIATTQYLPASSYLQCFS